jgi:hypothetical protein
MRIFGPKRDEVTASWRKLHNEELHNLCSSPNIVIIIKSRRMRLAGHVTCMGAKRNAHKVLVGKPKGKREAMYRWESMGWVYQFFIVKNNFKYKKGLSASSTQISDRIMTSM